ncbi:hypothetical protein V6N12_024786 [Hibiscus sabdariffa]|uniref:Uncharacterized protein n=1 Tax=Hibiscus sabdariffa TaxID=183260 RepID=A0ABR2B9W3_9ROSI
MVVVAEVLPVDAAATPLDRGASNLSFNRRLLQVPANPWYRGISDGIGGAMSLDELSNVPVGSNVQTPLQTLSRQQLIVCLDFLSMSSTEKDQWVGKV